MKLSSKNQTSLVEALKTIKAIYPGFLEFFYQAVDEKNFYPDIQKKFQTLLTLLETEDSEEQLEIAIQNLIDASTEVPFISYPFQALLNITQTKDLEISHQGVSSSLFQKLSLWISHLVKKIFEHKAEKQYEAGIDALKKNMVNAHMEAFDQLVIESNREKYIGNQLNRIEEIVEKLEWLQKDALHPLKMNHYGTYSSTGAYSAVVAKGREALYRCLYNYKKPLESALKTRILSLLGEKITISDNSKRMINAIQSGLLGKDLPPYKAAFSEKYQAMEEKSNLPDSPLAYLLEEVSSQPVITRSTASIKVKNKDLGEGQQNQENQLDDQIDVGIDDEKIEALYLKQTEEYRKQREEIDLLKKEIKIQSEMTQSLKTQVETKKNELDLFSKQVKAEKEHFISLTQQVEQEERISQTLIKQHEKQQEILFSLNQQFEQQKQFQQSLAEQIKQEEEAFSLIREQLENSPSQSMLNQLQEIQKVSQSLTEQLLKQEKDFQILIERFEKEKQISEVLIKQVGEEKCTSESLFKQIGKEKQVSKNLLEQSEKQNKALSQIQNQLNEIKLQVEELLKKKNQSLTHRGSLGFFNSSQNKMSTSSEVKSPTYK